MAEDGFINVRDSKGNTKTMVLHEIVLDDENVKAIYEIASKIKNKYIARTMVNTYDGSVDPETYRLGYSEYFIAGYEGKGFDDFNSANPHADEINFTTKIAAYEAGKNYRADLDSDNKNTAAENITNSVAISRDLGYNNNKQSTKTTYDIISEKVEGKSLFAEKIDEILAKHNISLDEFNSLRLRDISTLEDPQKEILKSIRESIPKPDENTQLQRVIPLSDMKKYLDGLYTGVKGFVARLDDVKHLITYDDIYSSIRLDYNNSPYNPFNDNSLAVIRFTTSETTTISVPYGKEMGGIEDSPSPFTGNGFLKSINGQILPEYKFYDFVELSDGAQLIEIYKDGTQKLRAVYSESEEKFIPKLKLIVGGFL